MYLCIEIRFVMLDVSVPSTSFVFSMSVHL
jgi:hypothetical protein